MSESSIDSHSREARIVTIIPKDQYSGELIISRASGTMFYQYDLRNEYDWTGFQYQHLLEAFMPDDEIAVSP
jgi:hypothetical protein